MRAPAIILVLALCAAPAFAADAPATASNNTRDLSSDKPIAVNADDFAADLNAETGTYTGNVLVVQGTVKLHADQVMVAAPGGKASHMEARGHVVVDSPSGTATGELGTYDVAAQTVHLAGNVVLTKDNNVMRGTALDVNIADGKARLTGGMSGAAQASGPASGRVQGLFVPAQKNSPVNGKP